MIIPKIVTHSKLTPPRQGLSHEELKELKYYLNIANYQQSEKIIELIHRKMAKELKNRGYRG